MQGFRKNIGFIVFSCIDVPMEMEYWAVFLYRVSQKHGVSVSFSVLGDKRNMAIKLVFCTGCLNTWVWALLDSHGLNERNFWTGCPKNTVSLFLYMMYKYTCKRNYFVLGVSISIGNFLSSSYWHLISNIFYHYL